MFPKSFMNSLYQKLVASALIIMMAYIALAFILA